jgi:hypothetical protein
MSAEVQSVHLGDLPQPMSKKYNFYSIYSICLLFCFLSFMTYSFSLSYYILSFPILSQIRICPEERPQLPPRIEIQWTGNRERSRQWQTSSPLYVYLHLRQPSTGTCTDKNKGKHRGRHFLVCKRFGVGRG